LAIAEILNKYSNDNRNGEAIIYGTDCIEMKYGIPGLFSFYVLAKRLEEMDDSIITEDYTKAFIEKIGEKVCDQFQNGKDNQILLYLLKCLEVWVSDEYKTSEQLLQSYFQWLTKCGKDENTFKIIKRLHKIFIFFATSFKGSMDVLIKLLNYFTTYFILGNGIGIECKYTTTFQENALEFLKISLENYPSQAMVIPYAGSTIIEHLCTD
jgi:hypothetical protein